MPDYTHTLIPDSVSFAPAPMQVGAFLTYLASIGAAPLKSTITVAKLTAEVRSFPNPFTGTIECCPTRKTDLVKNIAAISGVLEGLDDYNLTIAGKGPPKLPALRFQFEGRYDFLVHCCLRPEVVSTSDCHDEVPVKRHVEFFGHSCSPKDRLGIYHNPATLATIEVANAGCARFWIEFEYGKMLFPSIKDSLDLIEPTIVQAAERAFAISLTKGATGAHDKLLQQPSGPWPAFRAQARHHMWQCFFR